MGLHFCTSGEADSLSCVFAAGLQVQPVLLPGRLVHCCVCCDFGCQANRGDSLLHFVINQTVRLVCSLLVAGASCASTRLPRPSLPLPLPLCTPRCWAAPRSAWPLWSSTAACASGCSCWRRCCWHVSRTCHGTQPCLRSVAQGAQGGCGSGRQHCTLHNYLCSVLSHAAAATMIINISQVPPQGTSSLL